MSTLFLDLESFCETPITSGTHRYAEDAEILLVALAVDDDPVVVWDLTDGCDVKSRLRRLQQMVDEATKIVIHNSAFDRTVLRHRGVIIPVEKIDDTMVMALAHSLPGSLGTLCDVLGVPQDKAKDKDGKKLIQLFTKPRPKNMKVRRATRDTHPDKWADFIAYAALDVDAMRSIYGRLPRWNLSESERRYWLLDQMVNDRGFAVDVDLAKSALGAFDRASRSLADAAAVATDGLIRSTTQRALLLKHLEEDHGFLLPDMTKDTVARVLKDGDVPPAVRLLLENRQQAAAASPAKYKALLKAVSSDNRLRGTLQFCGASRTGRDAGRIFQPQNLPRPSLTNAEIEIGIEAMKGGIEDLLFDNVSDLCASAVRGCIVAPEGGHRLVIADLSNIEGRVLAWLTGEAWKVQAFKDYDTIIGTDAKGKPVRKGHDLYVMAYARSFGVEPEAVVLNKEEGDGSMRQIGKVQELALGYQGGVGAFHKMGGAVAERFTDDEIKEIVYKWRAAHPNVKRFWYDVEGAARLAITHHGESFRVRDLMFSVRNDEQGVPWLLSKTPSGRFLTYRNPLIEKEVCPDCKGEGKVLAGGFVEDGGTAKLEICFPCSGEGFFGSNKITYEGMNQYTRKWQRLDTYGGKITENLVQFIARDVFFHGLELAEREGFETVLRVHDELVTEVPLEGGLTSDRLADLMATNPSWSTGLPLAAAGYETLRYRKD